MISTLLIARDPNTHQVGSHTPGDGLEAMLTSPHTEGEAWGGSNHHQPHTTAIALSSTNTTYTQVGAWREAGSCGLSPQRKLHWCRGHPTSKWLGLEGDVLGAGVVSSIQQSKFKF